MPRRYEGIKRSLRRKHGYAGADLKTRAAKIFEATRGEGEEHIQTTVARERRRAKARRARRGRANR